MKLNFLFLFAITLTAISCGGSSGASGNASTTTEAPAEPAGSPAEKPEPAQMDRQSAPPKQGPFEEKLTDGPVTFIVESPNTTPNYFTLDTEGMSVRNEETKVDVSAPVVRAQLADLNQDGFPEVYIFTRSGNGTEKAYAFASYRNRSYGQIYIAGSETEASQRGNASGVTYELTETSLLRTFQGAQNDQRAGETQTVQYKLKKGETSYRLEPVE